MTVVMCQACSFKKKLRLDRVYPLDHWDISTQSFKIYSWRYDKGPGMPFLGYLALTCTRVKRYMPSRPMVLHISISDPRCVESKEKALLYLRRTERTTPRDFVYRMNFSTERSRDCLDGIRMHRLFEDRRRYAVQSSHCLADGNALEAELSLLKIPTSPQEIVVINIRRCRNGLMTFESSSRSQ